MACKVLDCRIGGEHPAILVACKPDWIVHIHLDKVLIETIIATNPPPRCVLEKARRKINIRANKTREGLRGCWVRVQEIGLSFLGQFTISIIASEIRKACPFQHKSTNGCKTVSGRAVRAFGVKIEVIGRDSRRRVKRKRQVVRQALCLVENSLHSSSVVCETGQGSAQEIIPCARLVCKSAAMSAFGLVTCQQPSQIPNCCLEKRNLGAGNRRTEINRANIVQDNVGHICVPHDKGRGEGINGTCSPAISRKRQYWSAFLGSQWVTDLESEKLLDIGCSSS